MKKTTYLLLFIALFQQNVFSQNTFEILLNKDNAQMTTAIAIDNNGDYITTAIERKDNNYNSIITKINCYGKILDSIYLDKNIGKTIYDIINIENNEFIVIGGYHNNTIDNMFSWIMKINDNLDIIWTKKILLGNELQRCNAKLNSKGNIILYGGVQTDNTTYRSFFSEINTNGNVLKTNFYEYRGIPVMIFDAIEKKDTTGYYLFQFNDFFSLEIDTNLNVIKNRRYLPSFPDNSTMGPNSNNCFWLTDTTFIISGHKSNIDLDISLIITDTSYKALYNYVETTQTRDVIAFWDNLSFSNTNNIYLLGTLNNSLDQYETRPSNIVIFNFNDTLRLNWKKTIGGDAYYNATNIIATQDGGCFIAATRSDKDNYKDYDRYFIKLDSLGNITHINGKPTKISDFAVYPNPASDFINIKKAVQIEQADFILYNQLGQKTLQHSLNENITNVNIQNLPAGNYVYNIIQNGKIIDSGKIVKR